MDNRISGLLDLAEVLKDQPPATTYPDVPLDVWLTYPDRDAALEAVFLYGATILQDTKLCLVAARGFAQEQGNYFPGARLMVSWSR